MNIIEQTSKYEEIRQSLSPETIIEIVVDVLGAHTYKEFNDHIIFPTICHNSESVGSSLKLYYYKESKLFHCYTQCGETFDIFGLFIRYYKTRGITYDWYHDILFKITDPQTYFLYGNASTFKYKAQRTQYNKRRRNVILPQYPQEIINIYSHHFPVEWTYENISDETMELFKIRFSSIDDKIIIPHYDINGNLIGIRGRALNPYEIENFGKYAPVKIEDKWYSHPLSLNLYGIHLNKENISRNRKVILFESEKSVLLFEQYFGRENNIALAVCGSNFNKMQLNLLLRNFEINEIIIAFDKEYITHPSTISFNYFNKLCTICNKYKNYCNFSFIFDSNGLLGEKDAPIDRGKGIFEILLKNRVRVK